VLTTKSETNKCHTELESKKPTELKKIKIKWNQEKKGQTGCISAETNGKRIEKNRSGQNMKDVA
jgi:hypothetical protein